MARALRKRGAVEHLVDKGHPGLPPSLAGPEISAFVPSCRCDLEDQSVLHFLPQWAGDQQNATLPGLTSLPTPPSMYDRPAVAALRDSLQSVVAFHPMLADGARLATLQERVWAVVDDLKAQGWPPERVIVAVKQIAADAGLTTSRAVLLVSEPLVEGDAVITALVRWCIEGYYNVGWAPSSKPNA